MGQEADVIEIEEVEENTEPEDRGDVVTPTKEEPEEDTKGTEEEPEEDTKGTEEEPEEDTKGTEEEPEEDTKGTEEEPTMVPSARVGQISREKTASQAIADGLVNDTVDKSIVKDLGGVKKVAKALAKGELQLSDIAVQEAGDVNKPKNTEPTADDLWDQYSTAVDELDQDKAKDLLRQARAADRKEISKEATDLVKAQIEESETQKAVQTDYDKANEFFQEIATKYVDLKDIESETYTDFIAMSQGLTSRMSYSEAVKHTAKKLLGWGKVEPDKNLPEADRVAKNRKKESLKKNADASNKQPPSIADNAGTKHNKRTLRMSELSEEEFEKLSPAEKKRQRGDEL